MRRVLPFAPAAVRDFLGSNAEYTAEVPAELISTRDYPDKITRPFVLCRPAIGNGVDPMLRRMMVQVDVYAPPLEVIRASSDPDVVARFGSTDPEELAWDLAALAAELLGRTRSQQFRNCTWTAEWREGPLSMPEKVRGPDLQLYRSPVRVLLKMTVRD